VKHPRANAALTLPEIVVSLAVASFVVMGALSLFVLLQRTFYSASETTKFNARSRVTQDRLVDEFRALESIDSILVDADGHSRRFTGQLVDLGSGAPRQVTYSFAGAQSALVRTDVDSGTSLTLMDELSDARFTFFQRSGIGSAAQTNAPLAVNAIKVDLIPVERRATLWGNNEPIQSAVVQLRNRAIE